MRIYRKGLECEICHTCERDIYPSCFLSSEAIRAQRFDTQIETLLDRDLRLVYATNLPFRTIRGFAVHLANRQGLPLELTEAARSTRISVPTLRKLLMAFEAIFLVRVLACEGGEKRPVVYFEDQGEASRLQSEGRSELDDWERFLYANLRTQWMYRPEAQATLTQYRTRGGAFIPFVLRSRRHTLGIVPMLEENPGLGALGSARSFLNQNPKAKVVFVHPGKKDWLLRDDQRIVGAGVLLRPARKQSAGRSTRSPLT